MKYNLKIREKLILLAIKDPKQEHQFTARFLGLHNGWVSLSQLYLEGNLVANHVNLPQHKCRLAKNIKAGTALKIKAKAGFYLKNGTRYGCLIDPVVCEATTA